MKFKIKENLNNLTSNELKKGLNFAPLGKVAMIKIGFAVGCGPARFFLKAGFLIVLPLILFFSSKAHACSAFRVISKDGTIISARTMEFGIDMDYAMIIVPRNKRFLSPASEGKSGISWNTKYGYVASNAMGKEEYISDGLNEAGLSFSWLWYKGEMEWQKVGPRESRLALANSMLGSWILGNFSSVEEVSRALEEVKVFGHRAPEAGGFVFPAHIVLHDASGGCVVIEYEKGNLNVYDNQLGIMTNAPEFPWMLTNLRNYVGMSAAQLEPAEFGGQFYKAMGHGSGMFGLPGDISPPSRFVRLAIMTKFADQPDDAEAALNLAQHIVSSLHIVSGMAVDRDKDGKVKANETTQWSTYRDHKNRILYFRTYNNFNLRKIDLKRLDLSAERVKVISMYEDQEIIIDVTERAK